jgi:hypothetical protein
MLISNFSTGAPVEMSRLRENHVRRLSDHGHVVIDMRAVEAFYKTGGCQQGCMNSFLQGNCGMGHSGFLKLD